MISRRWGRCGSCCPPRSAAGPPCTLSPRHRWDICAGGTALWLAWRWGTLRPGRSRRSPGPARCACDSVWSERWCSGSDIVSSFLWCSPHTLLSTDCTQVHIRVRRGTAAAPASRLAGHPRPAAPMGEVPGLCTNISCLDGVLFRWGALSPVAH